MDLPEGSYIARYLPNAFFSDRWTITVPTKRNVTAMSLYIESLRRLPSWANAFMRVRNVLCRMVGLKDIGVFHEVLRIKHPNDYLVGDRVGIFSVVSNEPNEVVLEDCDRHLNVRVSMQIIPSNQDSTSQVSITTVVHAHNWFGKVYMIIVYPVHKLILWRSTRQIKSLFQSNRFLILPD
ncbi:DUF2867 domain-containing protein [Marinomonas piezotolerans]|uniref:DUF2867 domain-containing protein n=1 Tax=Marinomonas piezotolerans TaxID=2213058 RepID=A0A370UBS2_9GAMM|nr:DUF2867 domain-containing protein [Marinomonas piezotolerans]RDL45198.1 DUF2867 domain-containing protein [Marinomonas piezotolerans]